MGRPEPAYRVLADNLRTAILQNHYPDGRRLPTEAELIAEIEREKRLIGAHLDQQDVSNASDPETP